MKVTRRDQALLIKLSSYGMLSTKQVGFYFFPAELGFIRTKSVNQKAIELEDAFKFFSYLSPLYRDLAMFQFFTASRIGEVAGLQWNRINFERREIVIMETCQLDMSTRLTSNSILIQRIVKLDLFI